MYVKKSAVASKPEVKRTAAGKGKVRARPAASAAWVWLNTRQKPRCEVRMAMAANKDVRKGQANLVGKEVLAQMSESKCRCTIQRERCRMAL